MATASLFFGRHLMMPYLIPLTPFSSGHIRPPCAPERMATASLFFGRHLMMPCQSFGLCFFACPVLKKFTEVEWCVQCVINYVSVF